MNEVIEQALLRIYLLDAEGRVGIEFPDGFISLEPRAAVFMAQSLMLTAMEADPDMDAEAVVDEFITEHTDKPEPNEVN